MEIFAELISREPRKKIYILFDLKVLIVISTKQTSHRNVEIRDMKKHGTYKKASGRKP